MSLARAFTTRKKKSVADISAPLPQRSNTTKYAFAPGTIRNKISGPVELLSTTNMLSYNAPDLYPTSQPVSTSPSSPPSLTHSSSSSTRSVSSAEQSISTPPTSPENDGRSPSPNHLSCYFEKRVSSDNEDPSAPSVPQRAPSHTKRSHEMVHRKRSISRMSQRTLSQGHNVKSSVSSFARDSLQMFSATPELVEDVSSPPSLSTTPSISSTPSPVPEPLRHNKKMSHSQSVQHPFGAELAQVTELAEEYGGVKIIEDPEEQDLVDRGYFKFGAEDYLAEIEGFYLNAFGPSPRTQLWI